MKLLVPFFLSVVIIAATGPATNALIYDVLSRDLGGGYSIAGGTMTTNSKGDIIEWTIPVTSALPYTFSGPRPDWPFAGLTTPFTVSPTAITFDFTGTAGDFAWFQGDEQIPSCFGCEQILSWNPVGIIEYRYVDLFDSDPFAIQKTSPFLPGAFLVATAVPEPNSIFLMLTGIAVGSFVVLRRRRAIAM